MEDLAWRMSEATMHGLEDSEGNNEAADKDATGPSKKSPRYQISSQSGSSQSSGRMDSVLSANTVVNQPHNTDGDGIDTHVVQSNVRLVPACLQLHGVVRSRDKDLKTSDYQPKYGCLSQVMCQESVVLPESAQPPPYRLTTADPQEDLKRWVLTPNDALDGNTEVRLRNIVKDPRYTFDMLLSALDLALQETRHESAHLHSLMEYAAREPYNRSTRWRQSDDPEFLDAKAADFANARRKDLEKTLFKAVDELDLLRSRVARFSKKVMEYKEAEARDGDWAEIADLLRMGAVDEEWVEQNCRTA